MDERKLSILYIGKNHTPERLALQSMGHKVRASVSAKNPDPYIKEKPDIIIASKLPYNQVKLVMERYAAQHGHLPRMVYVADQFNASLEYRLVCLAVESMFVGETGLVQHVHDMSRAVNRAPDAAKHQHRIGPGGVGKTETAALSSLAWPFQEDRSVPYYRVARIISDRPRREENTRVEDILCTRKPMDAQVLASLAKLHDRGDIGMWKRAEYNYVLLVTPEGLERTVDILERNDVMFTDQDIESLFAVSTAIKEGSTVITTSASAAGSRQIVNAIRRHGIPSETYLLLNPDKETVVRRFLSKYTRPGTFLDRRTREGLLAAYVTHLTPGDSEDAVCRFKREVADLAARQHEYEIPLVHASNGHVQYCTPVQRMLTLQHDEKEMRQLEYLTKTIESQSLYTMLQTLHESAYSHRHARRIGK